jgi:hypothetical protein
MCYPIWSIIYCIIYRSGDSCVARLRGMNTSGNKRHMNVYECMHVCSMHVSMHACMYACRQGRVEVIWLGREARVHAAKGTDRRQGTEDTQRRSGARARCRWRGHPDGPTVPRYPDGPTVYPNTYKTLEYLQRPSLQAR